MHVKHIYRVYVRGKMVKASPKPKGNKSKQQVKKKNIVTINQTSAPFRAGVILYSL
jgi:hypothetical protein